MKIRYKQMSDGLKAVAQVYSEDEHNIPYSKIDPNAISVVERLCDNGYESFIVGGAIRDILLNKTPKDFDVVTQASPRQIHKIFKNSRIIGKRFKLVHVFFGSKIIEVSTFRSNQEHDNHYDNIYGCVEDDCKRRDYSINSLYYNPCNRTLLDFNNSLKDFKLHKIRSLIPLNTTFEEDPVRIIRALKFAAITSFRLTLDLKFAIRKNSCLLLKVSSSRMTEELNKIISSGYSEKIFRYFDRYKIMVYFLPCISMYNNKTQFYKSLKELDDDISQYKAKNLEYPRYLQYYSVIKSFLIVSKDNNMNQSELFKDLFRQIKILLSPNTPANHDLEETCTHFMCQYGLIKKNPQKKASDTKKQKNIDGYQRRKGTKKSEPNTQLSD